jgi:TonB family protein
MHAFIVYELKAAAILAAFYLFYKLLLSREKLHRLNRIVLVATAVLSFVLPLCVITLHKTLPGSGPILANSEASLTKTAEGGAGLTWETVAVIVYFAGAAVVLASIVTGISRVTKLIRSGESREMDGTKVIVCKGDLAPFSWMKWIVLSESDFKSGNKHILEHEKAHVKLGHSKEVLLVDILSAFQWFNPAMWLLKSDLRAIHEYEADDAALRAGADIKEYQYSLIRKALSASGYSITNNFSHSTLKNRIMMMSSSKGSAKKGLRALYMLPLICGALALNAKTVISYDGSEIPSTQQMPVLREETPSPNADAMPGFMGGDASQFVKWVYENIKYPEEALAARIQGQVQVRFTVNESGKVVDVRVLKGVNPILDAEAVRVVSSSPDWTPCESNGVRVPVTLSFLMTFKAE